MIKKEIKFLFELKNLGLEEEIKIIIMEASKEKNGFFIVSGSTNALEKRATLTVLKELFNSSKKQTYEIRDIEEDRKFISVDASKNKAFAKMHSSCVMSTLTRLLKHTDHKEIKNNLKLIVSEIQVPKKCQICYGKGCCKCDDGKDGLLPLTEIAYFKNIKESDDIFDFGKLIVDGKLEYHSRQKKAQEYFENNLIFEDDLIDIQEDSVFELSSSNNNKPIVPIVPTHPEETLNALKLRVKELSEDVERALTDTGD